jgi:hypothetical protein
LFINNIIFYETRKFFIFLKYTGVEEKVEVGAGAEIFDKPEPHKYGSAPQHCRIGNTVENTGTNTVLEVLVCARSLC